MPRYAATKALIAKGLEGRESDEARALGYLQRLNLAGFDVKGQVSSAYGQSGFGLKLSAKVDFGALLVPFVHLDVGLDLEGERTAHSLLLLHRLPKVVWREDIDRLPQPSIDDAAAAAPPIALRPLWQTPSPLALAFMVGSTWRCKAQVFAKAWAGFGSDDFDETGLTVGASASGTLAGIVTRLADPGPRHYQAATSNLSLANDVDDLFADRLKAKAAAWLIETGGGVGDIEGLDTPRLSFRQRALEAGADEKAQAAILQTLDFYDKLTVNDVDSVSIGGVGFDVLRALSGAAKKVKAMVTSSKQLKTADLLGELDTATRALDLWIEFLKHPGDSFKGEERRRLWEIARRRRKEAADLVNALLRRQKLEALRANAPPKPAAAAATAVPAMLEIAVFEGSLQAAAGAKFVLPLKLEHAKLTLEAICQTRRIFFRYQVPVPGSGRRTLVSSQETAVTYVNRKVEAQGQALGEKGFFKSWPNLVTMSYRSVHVQWFDDLLPDNCLALPNGSGVSFGMSVLADSFSAYAIACKAIGPATPGQVTAALDKSLVALEGVLLAQLRVTPEELRAFMRSAPDWTADVKLDASTRAESYLVESSFAFKTPQKLSIETHRPKAMFTLGPVASLLGNPGGKRPDALRLQVLRLRFRVRSDDDKSRNLIQLGWNPEPWGEGLKPWGAGSASASDPWYVRLSGIDPKLPNWMKLPSLAVELGVGVERVRRVGSEGIVELHQHTFPPAYSPAPAPKGYGPERAGRLADANWRTITSLLVPPVALFSQ